MQQSPTQFLASKFRHWKNDPVAFVHEVFDLQLQEWQIKFLRDVVMHPQVAVRSAKGVGKTVALALIVLWWITVHEESKLAATSPSAGQLDDALWAEIKQVLNKRRKPYDELLPYEVTSDKIVFGNNFARYRTARADKPESLQGLHSKNMMFLIDEASAVDDAVFAAVQGARTTSGSKIVMTANPTRDSGYFYNAFHRSRARWVCHHIQAIDSPYVTSEYIEEVKSDWGENSPQYEVGVLGNFPTLSKNALIPAQIVREAMERVNSPSGSHVWGLDVARFGSDSCALAMRDAVRVYGVPTWRGKDLMETVGMTIDYYNEAAIKPVRIYIDVIGMGAGVYDRLKEQGYPVTPVNVALTNGVNIKKYPRLRDQLWFELKDWLKYAQIPKDEMLIEELMRLEYKFRSDGRVELEDKRESVGHSPDRADALALTMYHREVPANVQRQQYAVMNTSYGAEHGSLWKW